MNQIEAKKMHISNQISDWTTRF